MRAARRALAEMYGREPVLLYGSGSIPAVAMLQRHLSTDSILMGFGIASDSIHAPDECFGLDRFRRGTEAVARFLHHYAEEAAS
jgi:acetylornithine deacetylase/succinyl-diaminopimelate desuccinylase-like protein